MDRLCARCPAWLRAASFLGLFGLFIFVIAHRASAESAIETPSANAAAAHADDFRSRHVLLHTDVPPRDANALLEKLEALLVEISTYWGQPMKGKIECFVIADFSSFAPGALDPRGVAAVKAYEGTTLMSTEAKGKTVVVTAVVYSNTRSEVVLHEAVHAYCHQVFGRVGPVWYSEGMAELAHYWSDGDRTVRADDRELGFLRRSTQTPLAETLSSSHISGDGWQNYASRWSLCHFLSNNPNYAPQFRAMGRGILAGKDIDFAQSFGPRARELSFEYRFFLQHIDRGYRVDRCAWNWDRKFSASSGRPVTADVKADRGWQPTGVTLRPNVPYHYTAAGKWRLAGQTRDVGAAGDDHGAGRLVATVMNDYELGEEFELSEHGSLRLPDGGNLYLRCRSDWSTLADNSGLISVKFEIPPMPPRTKHPAAASAK
jgi:hypothetical protein